MEMMVVSRVRDFLQELLPSLELELFDVQFRREDRGWVLRIFIDSEEGVSLDDCTGVSRELGHFLDVEDFINHAYHLEVSSPGLERPLRNIDEMARSCGKKVKIKLHHAIDGEKVFLGVLDKVEGETVCIKTAEGKGLEVDYSQIGKARLAL